MISLEEVIEDYRRIIEEKIVDAEAAKKKLDRLIELQKIKNKRLSGEKLTNDDMHQAMNLLCWGSFAGCCSPSKNCPWNNAVSDALGVNYADLYCLKQNLVEKELKKLEG